MIEEVHYAVEDLVELIKTYQSKNRMSKVLTSTLFKRRQDELEAVVDRAILRLHVSGVKQHVLYQKRYTSPILCCGHVRPISFKPASGVLVGVVSGTEMSHRLGMIRHPLAI